MNPCGEVHGKYSLLPDPPLQAGEGAVHDALLNHALHRLLQVLRGDDLCNRHERQALFHFSASFPRQQWAFAGMTDRPEQEFIGEEEGKTCA